MKKLILFVLMPLCSMAGDWSFHDIYLNPDYQNKKSGTYCAKITATADSGYVYQKVPVVTANYYTFKGWGKSFASGHRFKITIEGQDTGTLYYNSDWVDNTSYTERSVTFKDVTDDTVYVKGKVETNGEIAYFDDWSLVPLVKGDASTNSPAAVTWPINLPIILR